MQIRNKHDLTEPTVPISERAVTLEDENGRASLTDLHYLENDCPVYARLQRAMSEI